MLLLAVPHAHSLANDAHRNSADAAETADPVLSGTFPSPVDVRFDEIEQTLHIQDPDWSIELPLSRKQLLSNIDPVQAALMGVPDFYEGQVAGDPRSWVRIAMEHIESGRYSGHVFTNDILYELQFQDEMDSHALRRMPAGLSLQDMVLPSPAEPPTEPGVTDDREASLRSTDGTVEAAPASRAIRIGITVDSAWNELHDQRGLAHALSLINGVDGLYQEQLGLALVVDAYRVYEDPTQDPLRDYPGDVDQILESYREVRIQDESLPADLALVHLFSGHADPDRVIGLGWIDTLCRLDGYDLSLSTPFAYDMLLAAHEIAHNLGAEHDDSAACSAYENMSNNEIMWSEISGATRPGFSSCSMQSIQPALNASCVVDNIDVGLQIEAEAGSEPSRIQVTLAALNHDLTREVSRLRSETRFPAGTQLSNPTAGCSISDTQLLCEHGALPPGGIAERSVTAEFLNHGATYPWVLSELIHDSFADTREQDNQASLSLEQAHLGLSDSVTFVDMTSEPASDPGSSPASGEDAPSPTTSLEDGTGSGGSAGAVSAGSASLTLLGLLALPLLRLRGKPASGLV